MTHIDKAPKETNGFDANVDYASFSERTPQQQKLQRHLGRIGTETTPPTDPEFAVYTDDASGPDQIPFGD